MIFVRLKPYSMKFFNFFSALLLVISSLQALGQESESKPIHFNGNISITNNGFSFIPTFSLGEPATVFEFNVGGDRLSFDPQFRFENNGFRPWSMIFIWRYSVVKQEKLLIRFGAHLPAVAFRHKSFNINGSMEDRLVAQRFVSPEFTLNYNVSKHFSFGAYSIYGFGLEEQDQTKRTFFFAMRVGLNQLEISDKIRLGINPQLYYLTMDGVDGLYTAANVGLAHTEFPISIGATFNQPINTNLSVDEFDWNLSLVYSFKTKLKRER